ncbi:MAG: hypothetical protein HC899_36965 [Leptolyngbyaceae cyanobacterium SM1_4_3]|nr:hypothetical protein [Leptolyngbyaceae cyanobacterium SM1_4_3]
MQDKFPMVELIYGNFRGIEGLVLRRSVQIKERLIPKLMQANPGLKEQYAAKLKHVNQLNSTIRNAKEIESINAKIEPLLEQLEGQLRQTDWLCGTTYSLADTVWTAVLNWFDELKFGSLWADNKHPALRAYFNRLKSRPSFITAIKSDEMPLPMILAGLRRIFLSI